MRPEPRRVERETVSPQIAQHVEEIGPDEVRQHETIVERRAPAHEARVIRFVPKARDQCADQQLLGEAHLGMRRHLERAEFHQAQAARRTFG